jgi:cysteinyl-tRNA synthetase, unknown class
MKGPWRTLAVFTALALVLLALTQVPAGPRPPVPPRNGIALTTVKTWGYQLQRARAELIPPEIDLLVIDIARDASERQIFTATDVAEFRRRPGAPDRIVLAYMSIGEAEMYRSYWRPAWTSSSLSSVLRPAWLGRENKEWKGNYLVRFWDPGWQQLFVIPRRSRIEALRQDYFGHDLPYIDKVIEAGFDGVYLDRVDSFAPWESTFPTAQSAMRTFVADISAYAKTRRPGFLVVPQNGEELVLDPAYRKAIDGIAKEDLVFGLDGSEHENPPDEIAHAAAALSTATKAGLPVLVVEYVRDPGRQQAALRHLLPRGFVPTFAVRDLNKPPTLPPPLAPPLVPEPQLTRPATAPP